MVPELDPELNPEISLWAEKGRKYEQREISPHIKEACDDVLAAYRKNPELYDEGASYYQVFRRPLGGIAEVLYEAEADTEKDNNLRREHQHFWGDNGDNFGFMAENKSKFVGDGVVRSDEGYSLDEYKKDVPGLGIRKFKGVYIRMARDILQNDYKVYHLINHNCQDYVDDVIAVANMLAEKNNDTLEIDE